MRKTRKNVRRHNKTRSRKRRAGSPSYLENTFLRWSAKYNAGIDIDQPIKKLIKAQNSFARDIVNTLGLRTTSDTYNHFIIALSKLTDEKEIKSYIDILNQIQTGDIPFSYVNDKIKFRYCKYKDRCTRTNPLHKVHAHYLDWTYPLLEQLHELR